MESQGLKLDVKLPNQCLGVDSFGRNCTEMLPQGKHVCDYCRKKIGLASKLASKISSGNGRRKEFTPRNI